MKSIFEIKRMRNFSNSWLGAGKTIALVPTMGNLHQGHISLLDRAKQIADKTIVSIFVNPIQFGMGEDYENYPSTLDDDLSKLNDLGIDMAFLPNLAELYPGGTETDTRVSVPQISDTLCGEYRKGHFSGVATVVSKLLINSRPNYVLFGEKDYQQLLVIKRMITDLILPVEVIAMPTFRESDGLAMSSRNQYLTAEERGKAGIIYRTLNTAEKALVNKVPIDKIEQKGKLDLEKAGMKVEYFSVRRQDNLLNADSKDKNLIILTAAWLGAARLIDNIKVQL